MPIVLLVVIVTIGVPVRMAWSALMSLLNRAPDESVTRQVSDIVDQSLAELPVSERFVRVIQPGRQRMVLVHVVLPQDYQPDGLRSLDVIRSQMQQALERAHVATIVDVMFTTDRKWGAPLSDGGAGGSSQ